MSQATVAQELRYKLYVHRLSESTGSQFLAIAQSSNLMKVGENVGGLRSGC
jgi:hypothetical protein